MQSNTHLAGDGRAPHISSNPDQSQRSLECRQGALLKVLDLQSETRRHAAPRKYLKKLWPTLAPRGVADSGNMFPVNWAHMSCKQFTTVKTAMTFARKMWHHYRMPHTFKPKSPRGYASTLEPSQMDASFLWHASIQEEPQLFGRTVTYP